MCFKYKEKKEYIYININIYINLCLILYVNINIINNLLFTYLFQSINYSFVLIDKWFIHIPLFQKRILFIYLSYLE